MLDTLILWLWWVLNTHQLAISVVMTLLFLIVLLLRFVARHLERLICDAPSAMLLVEASSGRVLLVNAEAVRLFGIRQLGTHYFYPNAFSPALFCQFLTDNYRHLPVPQRFHWRLSEHHGVDVMLTARRSQFRLRKVWVIHAQAYQATNKEMRQELEKLKVAQSALNSLNELVSIKDRSDSLLATNRAFEQFWAGRREEGLRNSDESHSGRVTERRWTTDPHGRSCLLETHHTSLMSQNGEPLGMLTISHDVTEWHKIQQDLRDEIERRQFTEVALSQRDTILHIILEASPDLIGIFDENMVYQACNLPFVEAIGFKRVSDLVGKRLQDLVPAAEYQRFEQSDREALYREEPMRYIDQVPTPDGEKEFTWYDVVKSPFRDPISGTRGVLIMARDISERFLAEQKLALANLELEKLSFIDSLTQIANRRRFDEQLNTMWYYHVREQLPLTLMLVDIDHFKEFNDHYGHQRGDEALIAVAQTFRKALARSSDCVARYGGEEFAILLPNTTTLGAQVLAERIHRKVAELNMVHQRSEVAGHVTVSIGLVSYTPKVSGTPEHAVALADSALYQAKSDGRNRTCVHPSSDAI